MSIRVQTEAEAVLQSESRAAGFSKDTNRDQAVKPSPSAFPSLSLCGTLSIIVKGVREGETVDLGQRSCPSPSSSSSGLVGVQLGGPVEIHHPEVKATLSCCKLLFWFQTTKTVTERSSFCRCFYGLSAAERRWRKYQDILLQ